MSQASRIITRARRAALAALVGCFAAVGISPTAARADTVWTLSSGANAKPFERPKVKIDGLQGDALLFR